MGHWDVFTGGQASNKNVFLQINYSLSELTNNQQFFSVKPIETKN